MIHLKDEVNALLQELGRLKKYNAPDEIRRVENRWNEKPDEGRGE